MFPMLVWIACLMVTQVLSHSDQLDLESVRELDLLLDGNCFTAEDGMTYDDATLQQFIYGKPPLNKPFVLVEVASLCDVARVLQFVKETKTEWRIRSGGHSYSGHSTCAGQCLVMDVSLLNEAKYDASRDLWLFGAGATLRQLSTAGAFPHGICPDIGIGGHVQGGGMGIFVSKLGFTLDHLVGAWVMLEKGKVIHATTTNEYRDLLWAIRGGGGGNWGVILLFEFKPRFDLVNDYIFHTVKVRHFIPDAAFFKSILKAGLHDFERPLLNRQALDPTHDYTPSFYLQATPDSFLDPNGPTYYFVNDLAWTREKADEASETRFAEYMNSLSTPSTRHSAIVNFTDSRIMYETGRFPACSAFFPKQAPFIPRTRLAFTSLEQNDPFLNAMTAFYNKWRLEKTAFMYFIFFPVGNSKFYDPDTSFFRGALHSVDMYAMAFSALGIPAAQRMVSDFESMIAPTLSTRQYINEFSPDDGFTDAAAADIYTRLYGGRNDETYLKLRDIKAKYDRKNFFKFPGSVVPSRKKVNSKGYKKMKSCSELILLGSVLNITRCPLYKKLNKKVQKARRSKIGRKFQDSFVLGQRGRLSDNSRFQIIGMVAGVVVLLAAACCGAFVMRSRKIAAELSPLLGVQEK